MEHTCKCNIPVHTGWTASGRVTWHIFPYNVCLPKANGSRAIFSSTKAQLWAQNLSTECGMWTQFFKHKQPARGILHTAAHWPPISPPLKWHDLQLQDWMQGILTHKHKTTWKHNKEGKISTVIWGLALLLFFTVFFRWYLVTKRPIYHIFIAEVAEERLLL